MPFDTPAETAASLPFFSLRAMRPDRKLLAALAFSVAVSLLSRPACAFAACVFAVCLMACSGIAWGVYGKRLLAINAFFLTLFLLLPLSFALRGEEALYTLGPLAFYPSGVCLAGLITLKGNAIAAALMALAGSSTVAENGRALAVLHVPQKLVALLLITHGNIALMAEEYRRLFQAARLRGFVPRTSLVSYGTHARLVALLLVRSWQHAQRVDTAMRLRGFRGRFPVLPSRCACPPHVRRRNRNAAAFLLTLCAAFGAALLLWDRML